MTSLNDILDALDAAVRAGEAAGDAIATCSDDPFARVLLMQTRLATGKHRESRDMLKAAILEAGKRR